MSSSSTPWYAWLLSAALAGLGLASGVTPARAQQQRDTYHPAPLDTISAQAYQGWKQFELNCSRCHGEYGVGTSFAPALIVSLKDGGTIPNKEVFIQTVCAGRPDKGMPSWCALGLEMDKIQNIYAYLKGRADGKIHAGRPAAKAGPEPGKSSS
jgi:mono/diheme cytochrome c family protein